MPTEEQTLFEVSLVPKCPDLHALFPQGVQYLIYDKCPASALARVNRHVTDNSPFHGGANAFHPFVKTRPILEIP